MSESTIDQVDEAGPLAAPHRALLCKVARRAIAARLGGDEAPVRAADFDPELRPPRATFVTLRKSDELRGCIGTLEAEHPLVESVWRNAQQAAFADPRFPALSAGELDEIEIHISILSPSEPVPVRSEQELLDRLRPGVDGLIIEDGRHRATFLPAVWDSLRIPRDFVRELKQKAGLPANHWSESLRVWRYTADSFP